MKNNHGYASIVRKNAATAKSTKAISKQDANWWPRIKPGDDRGAVAFRNRPMLLNVTPTKNK